MRYERCVLPTVMVLAIPAPVVPLVSEQLLEVLTPSALSLLGLPHKLWEELTKQSGQDKGTVAQEYDELN